MSMRTFPAGLIPIGEQKITCTSTAKYPINSTVRAGAQVVILSVETNDVRVSFSANSTVPSRATGILLQSDTVHQFAINGDTKFKFSSVNTTAGVVNLATFRYAGG